MRFRCCLRCSPLQRIAVQCSLPPSAQPQALVSPLKLRAGDPIGRGPGVRAAHTICETTVDAANRTVSRFHVHRCPDNDSAADKLADPINHNITARRNGKGGQQRTQVRPPLHGRHLGLPFLLTEANSSLGHDHLPAKRHPPRENQKAQQMLTLESRRTHCRTLRCSPFSPPTPAVLIAESENAM